MSWNERLLFGDDLRINPVGFGKHSDGLSVPSNAGGIDDNDRKTGLIAGLNQGMFITPGGFHHDTFDGIAFEDFDESPDVRLTVGDRIKLSGGMKGDIEIGLTNVDTDIDGYLDF